MDRFLKMDTMVKADGTTLSVKEYGEKYYGDPKVEVYKNSGYLVAKSLVKAFGDLDVWHLSIKRNDREVLHDWRALQEIKNELVGRYNEAIELYPSESRRVDTANQYHLWVFADPKYRIPVGFTTRLVADAGEKLFYNGEEIKGAKQRPFSKSFWKRLFGRR